MCTHRPGSAGSLTLLSLIVLLTGFSSIGAQQMEAEGSWWDRTQVRTSQYYSIRTDVAVDAARELARHLDRMYVEYARRLASLPPRAPEHLNVLVFEHRDEYELTLRTQYGIDARGTGGMFFVQPKGSALAFWIGGLSQQRINHVLQHEGFHQFAFSRFGRDLPVWVNEGLAEFFGQAVIVNNRLVTGLSSPHVLAAVQSAIERNESIAFSDMVNMSNEEWGMQVRGGDAALLYHQAWSMVHFLVYGDNGRYVERFDQYLRLINSGIPSDRAFVRAFETSETESFEARWKEHALRQRPSVFLAAMERMEFLAAGLDELRSRGRFPDSLETVRAALQEISFTYTVTMHGVSTTYSADDADLYRLTLSGEESDDAPRMEVQRETSRRMSRRERMLEQQHPTPATVVTHNLQPNDLRLVWQRDEQTNEFSWVIRVE